MIVLEHISKKFQAEEQEIGAVNDVSLTIRDGEIFGIIGFSGAGKSTLVRCINLLERPESGRVEVGGQDMLRLSPGDLRKARKKIGMIFQHFNLMPSRTVFGNVAYPLKNSGLGRKEVKEKVGRLLKLVEMEDRKEAYPAQLSGGQKQRVAIARALANDPDILLCDEATSALDPQSTESVLHLLKHLNEQLGITIVMITHEMEVIKSICGRVAVMEKGKLVEMNDVFSVFSDPKKQITRDFIRPSSNLFQVEEFAAANDPLVMPEPGQVLARLHYVRKDVSRPHISITARKYGIDMNIIFADIEIIGGALIGGTVVMISGESESIQAALKYLKRNHVEVEVIKDGRIAG